MRTAPPRLSTPLLAVLALATGCGGDASAPSAPTASVRDSAGVRIVDNTWSQAPIPGWRLAGEPLLVIGALDWDPAYEFTSLDGAVRLSDGRIAVLDGAVAELRIYGPDGTHLRTLGRKGSGPEEFQAPSLAGRLPGDTLVVFDSERRWVALVHPDAGFGRSFVLGEEAGAFVTQQGLLGSEAMAFGGGMFFSSEQGFPQGRVRPNSTYGTVGLDGSPGFTLGEIPAAEMWASSVGEGFRAQRLPFGRVTAVAAGPGRLYLGTNEAWDIRAFDPSGTLVARIRTDRPDRPVTADLRERFLEEELAEAEDEAERTEIRALYRDIPFADALPHYEVLRVDAAGCLWVREAALPGDETPRYAVFGPDGRLLGGMSLPTGLFPLEIGQDYLLGRVRDELGVESAVLYSLDRGR